MKIVVDLNMIPVDELDQFTNGEYTGLTNSEFLKNWLWRFVAEDNGSRVPEKEARAFVGAMGTADAFEASATVRRVIDDLIAVAFPKGSSTT